MGRSSEAAPGFDARRHSGTKTGVAGGDAGARTSRRCARITIGPSEDLIPSRLPASTTPSFPKRSRREGNGRTSRAQSQEDRGHHGNGGDTPGGERAGSDGRVERQDLGVAETIRAGRMKRRTRSGRATPSNPAGGRWMVLTRDPPDGPGAGLRRHRSGTRGTTSHCARRRRSRSRRSGVPASDRGPAA